MSQPEGKKETQIRKERRGMEGEKSDGLGGASENTQMGKRDKVGETECGSAGSWEQLERR